MNIEKMRKFHAWWLDDQQAELRAVFAEGWALRIWQQSRESLVIELPKIVDKEWANTQAERSAMREAIGWCKKRIEASGLKVKP